MGSTFQQQALRRKLIYAFLILALFCASLAVRQTKVYGLDAQAADLQLRDQDQGDVQLTGSALRLSLTGSRGLAVCLLWWTATEKQKKHEWNEVDLLVNSLTKLQPYFVTPWLFQSWNLSYNVSVESDRIQDKYYYIARGIDLLAEGERQNRLNPDLRFYLGFYNQQKIGLSDEANTFRCLYQLSCIDPGQRDPNRLRTQDRNGNTVIDQARFETFCQQHPMLVRRLRESLKYDTPNDIVDFLVESQKIPSRYEDKPPSTPGGQELPTPEKAFEKQFPVIPPADAEGLSSSDRADPHTVDFDNFAVARDWYIYANQPLPKPSPRLTGQSESYNPRIGERMPRYIAAILFRQYPARGQTYVSEYLEKEGWFGTEGWKITGGWFPDDKFQNGAYAVVGDGTSWASQAWNRAYNMWKAHGTSTGLYLEPEEIKSLDDRSKKYRERFHVQIFDKPPELPPGMDIDEETRASREAHSQLYWYSHERSLTNFPYFYFRCQVEVDPKAIDVRRAFFEADQLRKAANREQAMEKYAEALKQWADILGEHDAFRRSMLVQEDTFEIVVKYLDLVRERYGRDFRELMVVQDLLAQGAVRPPLAATWMPSFSLMRDAPLGIVSPLDRKDKDGYPFISSMAMSHVNERLGFGLESLKGKDIKPTMAKPMKSIRPTNVD
jgi:hypothetical protein